MSKHSPPRAHGPSHLATQRVRVCSYKRGVVVGLAEKILTVAAAAAVGIMSVGLHYPQWRQLKQLQLAQVARHFPLMEQATPAERQLLGLGYRPMVAAAAVLDQLMPQMAPAAAAGLN